MDATTISIHLVIILVPLLLHWLWRNRLVVPEKKPKTFTRLPNGGFLPDEPFPEEMYQKPIYKFDPSVGYVAPGDEAKKFEELKRNEKVFFIQDANGCDVAMGIR